MIFQDLVNHVNEMNIEKGYWFVRTDSGIYFDTFVKNNFIGIGWNQITIEDITHSTKAGNEVKSKIAATENIDIELSKGKGKATSIFNKLMRFNSLKKGDLVIIPSRNSSRYAFGVIQDSNIFSDIDNSHNCEYYKRKSVKWLSVEHVDKLDPIFYQIKITRHAISDIRKYANYIDNVTNSLYFKAGFGHFVLDIKTQKGINVITLIELVKSIQSLSEIINNTYDLNEDIDQNSIKLNLQSPGLIEFKLPIGKTLTILAAVLIMASCDNPDNVNISQPDKENLTELMDVHQETIEKIAVTLDELEVDRERMNTIY